MKLLEIGRSVEMQNEARLVRPRTARQLHGYVAAVLGFDVPVRPVVAGHDAPFDYLRHAFFEDGGGGEWDSGDPGLPRQWEISSGRAHGVGSSDPAWGTSERMLRDCVVWANRGGGKTQLGAIATLLDLVFKPGIQIRILGGSFEQSSKMYRYLKQMLETEGLGELIAGNLTGRYVELTNGSRVEVLSQSERAVRGQRVHKLRCDEVEMFHRDVWEAAQLTTRSGWCGDVYVHGAVEALSTMHEPWGLMRKLMDEVAASGRKLFRWSMLDTLERCEAQRECVGCRLWEECGGRAKLPVVSGFMKIDDAIVQKRRVGVETWAAEMLCERPDRSASVYKEFDPKVHVFDEEGGWNLDEVTLIGGIDFGWRSATVVLWAVVDGQDVVHVMDELSVNETVSERIIRMANEKCERGFAKGRRPAWMGADPAGHTRNDQTGVSTIGLWKRAGWRIRTRGMRIEPGIEAVKARLMSADGSVGLRVHRRCEKLIEALTAYRYPADEPESSEPVKDGHDHAADALRYMVVNLDREWCGVKVRGY